MRVLFFVFKMIIVVIMISFAVRMVSSAVFKPRPIEIIPDRYAGRLFPGNKSNAANANTNNPAHTKKPADERSNASNITSGNLNNSANETTVNENTSNSFNGERNKADRSSTQQGSNKSKDAGNNQTDISALEKSIKKFIPEEYLKALEKLPLQDKIAGFGLYAKIRISDQERLFSIIKDGVHENEYDEVNDILKQNLNDNDFARLKDILTRYKKAG